MKTGLSLFAFVLTFSTFAHATTVVYRGEIAGSQATLTVETATPAAVSKSVTGPIYDEERGHEMPAVTTYSAAIASATLQIGAFTAPTTFTALGSDHVNGVYYSVDFNFPSQALKGLTFDGRLSNLGFVANEKTVSDVAYPTAFDVRWYVRGTSESGTVHFARVQ